MTTPILKTPMENHINTVIAKCSRLFSHDCSSVFFYYFENDEAIKGTSSPWGGVGGGGGYFYTNS